MLTALKGHDFNKTYSATRRDTDLRTEPSRMSQHFRDNNGGITGGMKPKAISPSVHIKSMHLHTSGCSMNMSGHFYLTQIQVLRFVPVRARSLTQQAT